MTKTAFRIAALFGLVLAAGAPAAELKLASWNLEWLNRRDNAGNVRRQPADYAKLREYVAWLNADVVALQEVDGPEAARRVFDPREYAFHFENRNDLQRTGFAIRKGLQFRRNPDFRELALDGSVRRGADITIEIGGARLRLLAVHLKSGCFQNRLDTQDANCPKLKQQLPLLERWIDLRASEDAAFVVLGDFNRRFVPDDEFWPEIDDGEPANADLTDAGFGRLSRCQGGRYPVYIDHIVLDKRAADKMTPGSFDQLVFDTVDETRFRLSDHCPISVRLSIP